MAIWPEELSERLSMTRIFTHWLLDLWSFFFSAWNSWVSELETQPNLCSYKLTPLFYHLALGKKKTVVKTTFLTLLKPPGWQELIVRFLRPFSSLNS